jgi:hypothetical protein
MNEEKRGVLYSFASQREFVEEFGFRFLRRFRKRESVHGLFRRARDQV